jgi:uncharacterized protein (DUF1778 family)
MPATAHTKPVNIRIREDIRALIDRAAHVQGKSRSDFMVDAARRAAEEAILDQTYFELDAADYASFVDILDNPPPPGPKLKALMKRKPFQPRR